jgi:hypothetical protein
MEGNGTATTFKFLWWVLGLSVTIALLFLSLLIAKLDAMAARLNALESTQASVKEQLRQVESLAVVTRQAQLTWMVQFGDLATRLHTIEQALPTLPEP